MQPPTAINNLPPNAMQEMKFDVLLKGLLDKSGMQT
jgi:hypothetical protein